MADESSDNLTEYRLEMIEKTLRAISDNLTKLAALEQKHIETKESVERAFNAIAGQETRIRAMELEMPTLKLTRGWILSGMMAILSLIGVAMFKLFTIKIN